MNVIFSPEALLRLDDQLQYVSDRNEAAARRLRERVFDFVGEHLAHFPKNGHQIDDKLWERWIPGTRLVLWYEIHGDQIVIMSIWHTAQNRSGDDDDKD